MPPVSTIQPYLPVKESLVDATGILTPVGLQWFQSQAGNIANMATSINTVPGVNVFTVATQPSLGPGDAGFLGFESVYQHALRWTGSVWQFFGGSNNGFFVSTPFAPQSGLWQLCDGTATKYLTLGATLTETNFTVPDLITTPAYLKSIAAYTGTVNAKAGSTATGTTSTGTTGTGTTGTGTTGTGTTGSSTDTFTSGAPSALFAASLVGGGASGPPTNSHTHSGTTDGHTHSQTAMSVPGLSVPGLSVPGLTVPALGVGTIDMANLGVLTFFRR